MTSFFVSHSPLYGGWVLRGDGCEYLGVYRTEAAARDGLRLLREYDKAVAA